MAKITTVGQAVVVTSELKLEEIKKVAKYRPNELQLKGGKDDKEVVFAIGIGKGKINQYGASFDKETMDGEGKACITIMKEYEGDKEKISELIADEFGAALINLEKIEAKLPAVIEEIDKEKAAVLAKITMA